MTNQDENLDDDQVKDPEIEEATDQDSPEELKAKLDKANKQLQDAIRIKQNWRSKAIDPATGKPYKDLLDEASKSNQVKDPPQNEENKATAERLARLEQTEEKRTFGYQNNLSPEEADQVFAYAKGMGISPKDALEKPFVKSGIETIRTQRKAESAIPGSSFRSPKIEGRSFAELKPEDRKKSFAEVSRVFQKK